MPKRAPPPAPPAHLDAEAREIWRQVTAHLAKNGMLLGVDRYTIETFCLAVVRQRKLSAELDKAPLLEDGKVNPLLKVAEATATTVKNLGHVLGLNPMARRALPAKEPTEKGRRSVWHGVLD